MVEEEADKRHEPDTWRYPSATWVTNAVKDINERLELISQVFKLSYTPTGKRCEIERAIEDVKEAARALADTAVNVLR